MNITAIIEQNAESAGSRPCVYLDEDVWTWRDLAGRVRAVAFELQAAGVKPGQVVAQSFAAEHEQLLAMLATARLGATVFSLPRSTPEARRSLMLREVGANLMLTDEPTAFDSELPVLPLLAPSRIPAAGIAPPIPLPEPAAPWVIASGSGSTGRAKYLPISHAQQWARMQAGIRWLPYAEDDRLLSLIGLHFYASKLRYLEAFTRGAAIYLPDRGRPDIGTTAGDRYSVLYGTVFHMERLLQAARRIDRRGFASLRAVMVGGSAVSENLRSRIRDRLCPRLYVLYGANECSTSCCTRLAEVFGTPAGVGHPHPGFELQVVDEWNQPLSAGEAGQVRIRSASSIDGYLDDPAATARAFRGGWFYPGDLGRQTESGQLIHLGRADELMIIDGINVYPAEVEQALLGHPDVADAAAFPLPHPVHKDFPVALVCLRQGAGISEEELLRFAREHVGGYAVQRVFICERVPRNEQGKPLRDEMLREAGARMRRRGADMGAGRPVSVEIAAGASPPPRLKSPGFGGPGRARPAQPAQPVSLEFTLPPPVRPGALKAWLLVLEDDLPAPRTPDPDEQTDEVRRARHWLAGCLRMVRLFLQLLKVPIFDEPRILALDPHPSEGRAGQQWQAQVLLAQVDHVPALLIRTALPAAFELAGWAATRSPTTANRDRFFSLVEKHVRKPCIRHVPGGKSTLAVLQVAHDKGIPFRALGAGCYQLGWGARAQRIDRSSTSHDSMVGARLTRNKKLSAGLLRVAGLPVPEHSGVGSVEEARTAAERLGWPVVVKPVDLERGEGVSVDVDSEGLKAAFDDALLRSRNKQVLVERQVPGVCHRLFVASGRVLYAVKRLPMGVTGDGEHSVAELVTAEYAAQRCRPTWHRSPIRPLDALARKALTAQGLGEEDVPAAGRQVHLRRIESTAAGGVDEDVSATLHAENARIAVAAASLLGLDVAGVDIISTDITRPWHSNGAKINEVNYAPLLGGGDISRARIPEFLDRLLGGNGRIPVEVFVGGVAAWDAASERCRVLREEMPGACISSAERTEGVDGMAVEMPLKGLYRRARALVLFPWVEALVLVVQSDELLYAGLPLEAVDQVVNVDALLTDSHDPGARLSETGVRAVRELLADWSTAPTAEGPDGEP